MSFTRYLLANWGLAYVPQVGKAYRYASSGPFDIGPVLRPKQIKQGYVQYDIEHVSVLPSGTVETTVTTHACECGVFASMCRPA